MKVRVSAIFLPFIIAVAAGCGGGSGTASLGGLIATPAPTIAPLAMTTALGVLVDDPSGAPLPGVPVRVAPWTAGATPLPSPQTTTAADGSFRFSAPNGHYLLIIGSDSTTDTTRPTIHDNITLNGGSVTLQAPTLPAVPSITKPAVETGGAYRLVTINSTTEAPCFTAFNAQRTSRALPNVVADDWLVENARELNQYRVSPGYDVNNPGSTLTTGDGIAAGGSSCAEEASAAFATNPTYASSTNTLWFGAAYINPPGSGVLEFPLDPRFAVDPKLPNWP